MSIQVGSLTAPRPDQDAGNATALLEQTLRLLAENAGKSSPIE
jgi:hypothetical protein